MNEPKQVIDMLAAVEQNLRSVRRDLELAITQAVDFPWKVQQEREPVPVAEKWDSGYYYACGACGLKFGIVEKSPTYCPDCGRKVEWDD